MAALLESVLLRKVDVDKVVDWLKSVQEGEKLSFSEPQLAIQKQEFVPFLLNFLREQSSDALTNGPATPAKTPMPSAAPPGLQGGVLPQDRRALSASMPRKFASVTTWFLPRSGRGGPQSDEPGGRRSARGGGHGRMSEQVSPSTPAHLNFNNLEDFPPVGSCPVSSGTSKPSRRINPTPVSADRPHSKPKTCFTSTPLQKASSPPLGAEPLEGLGLTAKFLNVFIFCYVFTENLVPNVYLELFFVMQLLTSRSLHTHNDEEQLSLCSVNSVHNCVYFAVKVLENQFQLVAHLDKCTLRLLAENERVASFSPDLKDRLSQAQNRSTAKVRHVLSTSTFIHSVPFQPATDNRSNFGSDKAFHPLKKKRDIFYEALREWEDLHKEPGWNFDAALGTKIRGMMSQLTSAGNHSHFARLFLKQLVQMCKGPRTSTLSVDTTDADLLGMLGADSLGRLKRLEERLIQPHRVVGPCPPPSFPGHQEFFRDFIQTKPSREIQEASVALRSKVVLDVCAVLSNSVRRRRTILTVPWLVEFLSMLDFIGPLLLCYRVALGTLLLLYRSDSPQLNRHEEMCYLNKLLLVSVLGWLFQVKEFGVEFGPEVSRGSVTSQRYRSGLMFCLVSACSGEFRKLLAAFVSGSAAKSGGIIRKITPTSAELKGTPTANRSQQKLQVDLEQAFFHNQPPSLRRTVEFVAERVGSNAVKHINEIARSMLYSHGWMNIYCGSNGSVKIECELLQIVAFRVSVFTSTFIIFFF
uniref:Codanin 1 n=1 Tax=Poecilia latipinna TaxID=48699 RepID=A0A3B3VAB0_9TELE